MAIPVIDLTTSVLGYKDTCINPFPPFAFKAGESLTKGGRLA